MTEANIDILRRGIAAYNARDVEAFVALCDPEIRFQSALAAVDGARYDGRDGMRAWSADVEDIWGKETWVEPESYFDLGEVTLTFYALHGRGLSSGASVAMPVALVAKWRDGLIVELTAYADRSRALAELGVVRADLAEIAPKAWELRRRPAGG